MDTQVIVKGETGMSHSFSPTVSDVMSLAAANFSLTGGGKFCIKNNAEESVTLGVKYAKNADYGITAFIDTTIFPGWNPEGVVEVEQNAAEGLDLQWGI